MTKTRDLTIVIVSYNTKDMLEMTLESVYSTHTDYTFEVYVVDNASIDGSPEMVEKKFPRVELIKNSENVGFSRANNQAIRKTTSRYVLLLNSDVKVMPDTFDKMLSFMDNNHTVAIAGPKVVKPDNTLDLACRRSFPNPMNALFRLSGLSFLFPKSKLASYNLTYLPEDEILSVDSVMGACMIIRRSVIDEVGMLDEDYFMYGEDIDWCYRVKQAGYSVMYVPTTIVVHYKGSSSKKASRAALYEFHRAMVIFFDKHYREKYNFFIMLIVKLGIWIRYYLKVIQNSFRREKFVSK